MLKQCAWCGDALDDALGEGPSQPVSHGICAGCERELARGDFSVPLERFLESLDAPVLLVDMERGGRVRAANRAGFEAAGSSRERGRDRLLGEVFECANAVLPGGCGRTVHCSGCAIRDTVTRTARTGEAVTDVPATLTPEGADGTIDLRISAERVGGHVLLRLDRVGPRRSR